MGVFLVTLTTTLEDCMRVIDLCTRTGIRILGIIENERGAICKNGHEVVCKECDEPFEPLAYSSNDGDDPPLTTEDLAKETNLKYLGSIPLIGNFGKQISKGNPKLPDIALDPIKNGVILIQKEMG